MTRIHPGSMGSARVIQGHFAAGLPRLGGAAQPYALGRAAMLWGEDVAYWVKRLTKEQWESFLRKVSQGSTLAQKAIGINKKYSDVNQYPLVSDDYDSDDDRPDYVEKLKKL